MAGFMSLSPQSPMAAGKPKMPMAAPPPMAGPMPMPMPAPGQQPDGGFMSMTPAAPTPRRQNMGEGGARDRVRAVAAQGRDGDNMLAHINPAEAQVLRSMGGRGTINPRTGLREFAGGSLTYLDGVYSMSDGSALPWQADDGGSAGGPETTRTPRAMSGNSEAGDSERYADRGTEAAPAGGGVREDGPRPEAPTRATWYSGPNGETAQQYLGWTDADYAARAAAAEGSASDANNARGATDYSGYNPAAADKAAIEAEATRNQQNYDRVKKESPDWFGGSPTPTPTPAAGGAGGADNNGGNGNRLPAVDPFTPGKKIFQVNPAIPGAPQAYPWGTAPGGMMPAGAWPETMMDPRSGTTTYQAAPPPGANGAWINPNLLPWDVRNGGTGDPYVPWTPEWAAKQAMEGNGYAAQALANAGYDLEKIAPGASGALKSGQGASNLAGYDRGWKAEGFYQTKDGIYQDFNGVQQLPMGNGLFLDTMYGFLRNQQGIIVNSDGTPVVTKYNAGYPQGSSDPWRVFGSSHANAMMGQYAGLDLRSMNDGNNTPIRGNYGGGTPTPIQGKYLNDIRGNPWQGNPTPQHMGGGPTGPSTPPGSGGGGGGGVGGGGGGGGGNPTPVTPVGGAGAPINIPSIRAPSIRGNQASGFGLDGLYL